MVEEARLEQQEAGLTAVTDGWFVVNVRDAPWVTSEGLSDACIFEGDEAPFPQVGFTLAVLRPGEPSGLYHREANQENFLVLSGECLLLVEGEERHLRAWDFVHCPPGTDHILVGAGDGSLPRLHDGRARGLAREGHRLPPLRGGPPPRRGRGGGDDGAGRGLCLAAEVAARPAAELERPTLGLAAGRFAQRVLSVHGIGRALRRSCGACSGGEVAAEEATLADDSVETTTPDTGTAAEATPPPATAQPEPKSRLRLARVARVIDGDTLETADGRRIRLVQIDAPESSGECYGAQATAALEALLPAGSRIGLERDPELDDVDRYGRQLRYVFKGRRNLNVVLVRRGAASVWFFDGDRGRYADRLLATARDREGQEARGLGGMPGAARPDRGLRDVHEGSRHAGRRRPGPRACPATARACRSPAIWTARKSGRSGGRPCSSAGTIRTASTATATATAASERRRLARRPLGRGWDVLVEPEEVGGVVAPLDRRETIPRLAGV